MLHFAVGVLDLCTWLVQVPAGSLVGAPRSLQAGAAAPVVAPPQRQQLPAAAVLGGRGGSGQRGYPAHAGQSSPSIMLYRSSDERRIRLLTAFERGGRCRAAQA